MEVSAMGGGGGAAAGGPAPFLIKTYEMVDDCSTDDIVSWSSTNSSFVVWDPPEFAAKLLPTYFKHNNFSSFIRQLNTYGFRKIDPERWEFANDEFIKDQKHLLKNIHRRKPIHSHSHPPPGSSSSLSSSSASSFPDPERTALEEEIESLSREKAALAADLWRFQQQQSGTKIQLEDLERRLSDVERRQAKMISFLERALTNPRFVENLIRMLGSGATDFSSILHKKRRLPGVNGYCLEIADNGSFYQNNNNSNNNTCSGTLKPLDAGQVFNQDFSDKLKLGLCPAAISESNNLVSASTQSSNEAAGQSRNGNGTLECLSFVPDAVELSDTGTSLSPRKSALFSEPIDNGEDDDGDGDGLILCHLNLTLASSSMQIDKSTTMSRSPSNSMHDEEIGGKEEDATGDIAKNQSNNATGAANGNSPPLQGAPHTGHKETPPPPGRVNDVFWEQFLTERPGSSDTEEASSSLRADPSDDSKDERTTGDDRMPTDIKDIDQPSL